MRLTPKGLDDSSTLGPNCPLSIAINFTDAGSKRKIRIQSRKREMLICCL